MAAPSSVRISTGTLSFSGGANSNVVPTIASAFNPNGLRPDQIAWSNNATVRGGGIEPRRGWRYIGPIASGGLFQGAQMYAPDSGLPYLMTQISGQTFVARVDLPSMPVLDVSIVGDANSGTAVINWLCQGEQFMIINDGINLPLFWDGTSLRRSKGASVVYAITAANFNAPAIGQLVDVTLTSAYAGPNGQKVYLNGNATQAYQVQSQADFVTLKNINYFTVGTVVPAGTILRLMPFNGAEVATTLAAFTIPALGASVTVSLVSPISAVVGNNVWYNQGGGYLPGSYYFEITAIGTAPPAANHVYLVNLNDTAGATRNSPQNLASLAELPTGTAMDYYMGRVWMAGSEVYGDGRKYLAGDIVGSTATPTSGSPQYGFRDSILHNTENAYLSLGGTFLVPTQAGNIIGMSHPANLDTALGQGQLIIGTRKSIYSVNVVPERAAWAALSEPIQRVVQITFGFAGHRSVVTVNGDLFYQSVDGIRSLIQAIRYFEQWGNTALSNEEVRALALNIKELLLHSSGVEFDQRLLQTVLPQQTNEGVIHQGLMPLDFNPLSSMGTKLPPVWEGVLQGLGFLQVLAADYDGKQRCFAVVRSAFDHAIEVWELTDDELFDTNRDGEARIEWAFETPSYTWGKEFQLKQLETMEIWVDKVYGTVDFKVEVRADQSPCWEYWNAWQICAPRNACELPNAVTPCNYPQQPYKMQYKTMMTLPKPPSTCETANGRPIDQGYGFQFRITVKGYCRIRGLMVHAIERSKEPFKDIVC